MIWNLVAALFTGALAVVHYRQWRNPGPWRSASEAKVWFFILASLCLLNVLCLLPLAG
jgi:hypothetical protein